MTTKTKRPITGEETVPMTFRVARRCRDALQDAIAKQQYPATQSALIDRAIDLLIKDMRKKGEI